LVTGTGTVKSARTVTVKETRRGAKGGNRILITRYWVQGLELDRSFSFEILVVQCSLTDEWLKGFTMNGTGTSERVGLLNDFHGDNIVVEDIQFRHCYVGIDGETIMLQIRFLACWETE
jgi:hypothetical protein